MLLNIWQFIKRHKLAFSAIFLTSMLSSLLTIVPNFLIQEFIDGIVAGTLNANSLRTIALIFFTAATLLFIADSTWGILLFAHSRRYERDIRLQLFNKLLSLRSPFYEKFRSGEILTRMTSDIIFMGQIVGYGFMVAIGDVIWVISIVTVMILTISWQVTLIVLIPLIALIFVNYFVSVFVQKRYELNREAVSSLSSEVLEGVDGVRVIRAYGDKKGKVDSFEKATSTAMDRSNDLVALNATYFPMANLMVGLSSAIGILFSSYLITQGEMTVGQLVVLQIYIQLLSGAVWGFADIIPSYKQGIISFGKIDELIKAENLVEASGDLALTHIDHIEFKQYSFAYPETKTDILKEITLSIPQGKTIGIVGKTGSGKTTLVRQLLRQYPVGKDGHLLINGRDIVEYKIHDIESQISYVPQDHILFSKSVRDNILLGNPTASEAELEAVIDAADLRKDLRHLANGLETMIGEKGVSISGGQKQRISIARALIRKAELLILDDSLSAVDAKTETTIIKNIQSFRLEQTNIIVTHRLSAVAHADYIYVLTDGAISEEGTPQALLSQKGWYYSQYIAQQMDKEAVNEHF